MPNERVLKVTPRQMSGGGAFSSMRRTSKNNGWKTDKNLPLGYASHSSGTRSSGSASSVPNG
jgi:hypothetical protein